MPLNFDYDFKKPDIGRVYRERLIRAESLSDPLVLAGLKQFYKKNPAQFIIDWGTTFDPRNADVGLPTTMPFILFEKQEEWCSEVMSHWHNRKPLITDKSREVGVSWLSVALACTICMFHEGVVIGFGSRKEEYVDKIGAPKALFWKARTFMKFVPQEFRGSWNLSRNAPHMRILFPDTGSAITGESGDGIGRGDRTSIYFVDESAHIERPALMEASLSATTNCRIDISSANGMANMFAQRRWSGKIDVFTISWRDDPRKDEAWYAKQKEELDPVTLAQEIDINYSASVEGVVLPSEWVQAAVNACEKLKLTPTGQKFAALDVADEGKDLNAAAVRYGVELQFIRSWSGKGSDTLYTTQKMFEICDETECKTFQYDADGIGSSIRSDSRVVNEQRANQGRKRLEVLPFRGSGEVWEPEKEMVKERKNKDFFLNKKAQAWWHLRLLFQNTFRAVNGQGFDPEMLISIPANLPEFNKLIMELSQPTYKPTTSGKILINKAPDNTRSPNLADAVMMVYAPAKRHKGLFSALGSN